MLRQVSAILREMARRAMSWLRYPAGVMAALGIGLVLAVTSLILDMRESGADWEDE